MSCFSETSRRQALLRYCVRRERGPHRDSSRDSSEVFPLAWPRSDGSHYAGSLLPDSSGTGRDFDFGLRRRDDAAARGVRKHPRSEQRVGSGMRDHAWSRRSNFNKSYPWSPRHLDPRPKDGVQAHPRSRLRPAHGLLSARVGPPWALALPRDRRGLRAGRYAASVAEVETDGSEPWMIPRPARSAPGCLRTWVFPDGGVGTGSEVPDIPSRTRRPTLDSVKNI